MQKTSVTSIGGWQVQPDELSISNGELTHQFQSKVFHVLIVLAENQGNTITRDYLIEVVWNNNINVGQRGLNNAIWQLRKALQSDVLENDAIKTISKLGYQLTLKVEQEQPDLDRIKPSLSQALLAGTAFLLILFSIAAYLYIDNDVESQIANRYSTTPITFYEGMEELPDVSSDGKKLAFIREMADQNSTINVKSLVNPEAPLQLISIHDSAETRPVWGNNDESLAFLRLNRLGSCELFIKTLRDQSERFIDSCLYRRFIKTMDWSGDSRWIAYAKPLTNLDNAAIFIFDLQENRSRQFTFPDSSSVDSQIAWANSKNHLAFTRDHNNFSSLFIKILDGETKLLTTFDNLITGITWSSDDRAIIVNLFGQGRYEFWRYDVETGNKSLMHSDETLRNPTAVPDSGSYIFAKHAAKERIQLFSTKGKEESPIIRSSRRELYGEYSPQNNHFIFMSNRSGNFEIWIANKQGTNVKQVTKNSSAILIPSWGKDDVFVVTRAEKNNKKRDIFAGNINDNKLVNITSDSFDYRNLQWIEDNRFLVNSNRSGSWELWIVDIETKQLEQVTNFGAFYGQFNKEQNLLYFTKENTAGIWQLDMDSGIEKLVSNKLALDDWGNWGLVDDSLLYLRRGNQEDSLEAQNLSTGKIDVIKTFSKNQIKVNRGFRLRDSHFALTTLGHKESDLYILSPSTKTR